MKKINLLLRKCKTLSRQLGRTSSYSSLRSKSYRGERFFWGGCTGSELLQEDEDNDGRRSSSSSSNKSATVLVGRSRRRYVISSKHLNHPVLSALIERSSSSSSSSKQNPGGGDSNIAVVKCEVVLFDHLLWMLENADPNLSSDIDNNSLEELADLYAL